MVTKVETMMRAIRKASTLEEAQRTLGRLRKTDLRRKVTPALRKRVMTLHRRGLIPRQIIMAGVKLSAPTIRKIIRQETKGKRS